MSRAHADYTRGAAARTSMLEDNLINSAAKNCARHTYHILWVSNQHEIRTASSHHRWRWRLLGGHAPMYPAPVDPFQKRR